MDAVIEMPRYLNLMLRRYSTGTLSLDFIDRDLQDFEVALDSASDKLMIGLVVGSLVVGSSLVSGPLLCLSLRRCCYSRFSGTQLRCSSGSMQYTMASSCSSVSGGEMFRQRPDPQAGCVR